MPKQAPTTAPDLAPVRVRRGYFECRYGQLHLHNAMPPGGGFEEATALLCLHDCPGSGRTFRPFLTLAGRDRSAYAPDLPGFGESDAPLARPTLADYVGALGDFIDTMRLRRLDVLAQRAGAVLATELAITRGAQIGRVVMVSPQLPPAAGGEAGGATTDTPDGQRWVLQVIAQYPARERLARLTQKLLVLRAKDDAGEASARIREILPAARITDLAAPGREVWAGAPEPLIDAVRDFLRG